MINYKEYEKVVYDWLKSKNEGDKNFTFSLRMKGSKNNELDYFIGTENSKYFGTTFWTLPVNYPGSSSDCINLIFGYRDDDYFYHFEFGQTQSPIGLQNESALSLIKYIKQIETTGIEFTRESDEGSKMYNFKVEQRQSNYVNLDDMFEDIEEDMEIIIPIVESAIELEKINNPEFIANRITPEEFSTMEEKMERRFKKYAHLAECNYWIFQGNPKVYNIVNALKGGHLKSWKVAAHKNKITKGDKVIIWQTGKNAGCYGLAEVTSDVQEFEGEEFEKQHYINPEDSGLTERVKIKGLEYLAEAPILWEEIKGLEVFSNFKAGTQGTNFTATKEEYEGILKIIKGNKSRKFWLYAPGENASKWEEFYAQGLMCLGWDKLGDLNLLGDKNDITKAIQEKYNTDSKSYNNARANLEFRDVISVGDIVIPKKGRQDYLGYGIVTSDYYYDNDRTEYKKSRKINWIKKGVWNEPDGDIVLKTLTDITKYPDYVENLINMIGIEKKEHLTKSNISPMNSPLNKILYGPPGTGKTYKLKSEYFSKYTLQETSISKEQHFNKVVSNQTWWQIIALALLEIGKEANVSAILNNRWVVEKASLSESKNVRATIWGTLQMHTIEDSKNVNYKQRQVPYIFDKNDDKTWSLLKPELEEQSPELHEILDSANNFKANPDKIIENYDFVTFHQSFSYEDFIEGIKPVMPKEGEETDDLQYKIEDGVFKTLCKRADKDPDNRYAIFIDEINRGNVSSIFGELITLIELDKRKGAKNELKIKLPYSKTTFSVPSNIDIYGTMNTADRSVEALDTALRRRFSFEELLPKPSLLAVLDYKEVDLEKLLETINQRIEILIDKDHQIGHSYFFGISGIDDLKLVFKDKIIPLLEEYFYGDFGKIGLVLGTEFIEEHKTHSKDILAKFPSYTEIDFLTEKKIFRQKDINEMEAKHFISIYETVESK